MQTCWTTRALSPSQTAEQWVGPVRIQFELATPAPPCIVPFYGGMVKGKPCICRDSPPKAHDLGVQYPEHADEGTKAPGLCPWHSGMPRCTCTSTTQRRCVEWWTCWAGSSASPRCTTGRAATRQQRRTRPNAAKGLQGSSLFGPVACTGTPSMTKIVACSFQKSCRVALDLLGLPKCERE